MNATASEEINLSVAKLITARIAFYWNLDHINVHAAKLEPGNMEPEIHVKSSQNTGKKKFKAIKVQSAYVTEVTTGVHPHPFMANSTLVPNLEPLVNKIADAAIREKAIAPGEGINLLSTSFKPDRNDPENQYVWTLHESAKGFSVSKPKPPEELLNKTVVVTHKAPPKMKKTKSKMRGKSTAAVTQITVRAEKEINAPAIVGSEPPGAKTNPPGPGVEMIFSSFGSNSAQEVVVFPLMTIPSKVPAEKQTTNKNAAYTKSEVVKPDQVPNKNKSMASRSHLLAHKKPPQSSELGDNEKNADGKNKQKNKKSKSNLSLNFQAFRHAKDDHVDDLHDKLYKLQQKLEAEVKDLIAQMEKKEEFREGASDETIEKFKSLLEKQKQIIQLQMELRKGIAAHFGSQIGFLSKDAGKVDDGGSYLPRETGYHSELFAPYACERDGKMVFFCSTCQVSSDSELLFRLHLESPQHMLKAYEELQKDVPKELGKNRLRRIELKGPK